MLENSPDKYNLAESQDLNPIEKFDIDASPHKPSLIKNSALSNQTSKSVNF